MELQLTATSGRRDGCESTGVLPLRASYVRSIASCTIKGSRNKTYGSLKVLTPAPAETLNPLKQTVVISGFKRGSWSIMFMEN